MRRLAAAFLALVLAGHMSAVGAGTEFSTANKLYSEGQFSAAGAGYEKILRAGAASPALYFDYGNAEFKAGHLGLAIVAYRRAELLSPRDPDVRANLEFTRDQVQGTSQRKGAWQGWLGMLTLDEWTVLVAVAFWLTFGLLATRQARPAWGSRLRGPTFALAAIAILSGAALGLRADDHFSKQTAVIVAAVATARSGPFDGAQSVFTERDGVELSVLGRYGDWVQVAGGSGKSGWLQTTQVEVLPGG
jgi:tetratricopeptide (TPR) repeat protein